MSAYAGAFPARRSPHGTMNSFVYPVHGGMEDWAYAGSWAGSSKPCTPRTFGGYAAERTQYQDSELRVLD